MLKKGITFEDLAKETGYSVATIHNHLSLNSATPKIRQAITNALQIDELWPGVFVTERIFHFPAETELEFPNSKSARVAADELPPGIVKLSGTVLTFLQTATFSIDLDQSKSNTDTNRKIAASNNE